MDLYPATLEEILIAVTKLKINEEHVLCFTAELLKNNCSPELSVAEIDRHLAYLHNKYPRLLEKERANEFFHDVYIMRVEGLAELAHDPGLDMHVSVMVLSNCPQPVCVVRQGL